MSLIEDALRGLQNPNLPQVPYPQGPDAVPPAAPHPSPPIPPASSRAPQPAAVSSRMRVVVGAAVLAAIALLLSAQAARRKSLTPHDAPTPQAQVGQSSPVPAPSEPVAPIPEPPTQPRYTVTGIAEGGTTPVVVVNGQIVAIGDRVDGARLVDIRGGAAYLRTDDGEDVTLRIPR